MNELFSGILSAITLGAKIILFLLWISFISSSYHYQGMQGAIYVSVVGVAVIWFLVKQEKSVAKKTSLTTPIETKEELIVNESKKGMEDFIAHGEFLKNNFIHDDHWQQKND